MFQPPLTIATERTGAAVARMATWSEGFHAYGADFHTSWGIPATVRHHKAADKATNARPTRRGAPPH